MLVVMPTEIALTDGTKLYVDDPNMREDDVIKKLTSRPDYQTTAFVHFQTTNGSYRVNANEVVSVRWIDETSFAGGAE